MIRVALDANLLVHAEAVIRHPDDRAKTIRARALLDTLAGDAAWQLVVPTQALAELFIVLRRKGGRDGSSARTAVRRYSELHVVASTSKAILVAALDLAADTQFSIFDAIIVNAAAEAGCRFLLSEDMQDGFVWRGVRIVAPFYGDALLPPALRSSGIARLRPAG